MRDFSMNVLGIHSSPFIEGNTAFHLNYALEEAAKVGGVTTESVSLAGLTIADCSQCDWCMTNQTADDLCGVNDDATPILAKISQCDVLILATPVYFGRMSGSMACLIDRTRCFIYGKHKHLALKGKVGVALTVGWYRQLGIESTLASLHQAFLIHEMLTPSCHIAGALYGVGLISGLEDEQVAATEEHLGVKHDQQGLRSTRLLVREALNIAAASVSGAKS
jgi:multimeric flavodoxin WrbA